MGKTRRVIRRVVDGAVKYGPPVAVLVKTAWDIWNSGGPGPHLG